MSPSIISRLVPPAGVALDCARMRRIFFNRALNQCQAIEALKQAPHQRRAGRAARLILFLTVFIDLLGFGIVIPLLPMFASRLGDFGASASGAILAVYSLAQLSARRSWGASPIASDAVRSSCWGCSARPSGYLDLRIRRIVLLAARCRARCTARAPRRSRPRRPTSPTPPTKSNRARGMGMIGAAFGLGFVLGPAIGGLLGQRFAHPGILRRALTFANLIFAAALPESHLPEPGARLDLCPEHRAAAAHCRASSSAIICAAVLDRVSDHLRAGGVRDDLCDDDSRGLRLRRLRRRRVARVRRADAGAGAGIPARQNREPIRRAAAAAVGCSRCARRDGAARPFHSHGALLAMLALVSLGYGFASPSIASLISKHRARSAGRSAGHQSVGDVAGADLSGPSRAGSPINAGTRGALCRRRRRGLYLRCGNQRNRCPPSGP